MEREKQIQVSVNGELDDLTALENKLAGQMESRFSSLDGRIEELIGLIGSSQGCIQHRSKVDNGISRHSNVPEPLILTENNMNCDFRLESHVNDDDVITTRSERAKRHRAFIIRGRG